MNRFFADFSMYREVGNIVSGNFSETQKFNNFEKLSRAEPRDVLLTVYKALTEKGYSPVNQIVGYILSGDPTYITSHNNARSLISKLERDELLEEMARFYLGENTKDS
ncbi:MAG: IreB family regulatory phosphoprotein [Clostridiales bacterium]|jgi:uncharacterized protein (UPF0297 family)|nr:IreB family regulatory phosphoprotein [Clostridiales bacterium]